MPWYDTYGDDKTWYEDGEEPWANKAREVKPGMYILDPVEPPKEMVVDSIDELIVSMPKHRKFLEGVKKNILERYEDDVWTNKHSRYLPWTFRLVYRVWGLRAALRFLLKGVK